MLSKTCCACVSVPQCATISSAYLSNGTPGCTRRIQSSNARCRKILATRGLTTPRTQKVTSVVCEVIGGIRGWAVVPIRWSRWNGNAVAYHDRVIADEHLLDDQAHDPLPLDDVERIGGHSQTSQKRRERLGQAEVHRPFPRLFSDRLQFGPQCVFTLAQWRHPLPQLFQRQEFLLIRGEHSLDALADPHQIPFQGLFALLRGVGRTCHSEPTIEFRLNQGRILE